MKSLQKMPRILLIILAGAFLIAIIRLPSILCRFYVVATSSDGIWPYEPVGFLRTIPLDSIFLVIYLWLDYHYLVNREKSRWILLWVVIVAVRYIASAGDWFTTSQIRLWNSTIGRYRQQQQDRISQVGRIDWASGDMA